MDKKSQVSSLEHNLTSHIPSPGDIEKIEHIREVAKMLGHTIIGDCPVSREQSLSLTNLEQTVMWAVAAIARNQN